MIAIVVLAAAASAAASVAAEATANGGLWYWPPVDGVPRPHAPLGDDPVAAPGDPAKLAADTQLMGHADPALIAGGAGIRQKDYRTLGRMYGFSELLLRRNDTLRLPPECLGAVDTAASMKGSNEDFVAFFRRYHTASQIYGYMRWLATLPFGKGHTAAEVLFLGKSAEGRPIRALHLTFGDRATAAASASAAAAAGSTKKKRKRLRRGAGRDRATLVVLGGMHGREWTTSLSVLWSATQIMRECATAGGDDSGGGERPPCRFPHVSFRFIPLVNPDGLAYTQKDEGDVPHDRAVESYLAETRESANALLSAAAVRVAKRKKVHLRSYLPRYWRKNRAKNAAQQDRGAPRASRGVDLNRNWGPRSLWGKGAKQGWSELYQGPGPGSEPEAKAVSSHVLAYVDGASSGLLDVHCCMAALLEPFAAHDFPPEEKEVWEGLGRSLVRSVNEAGLAVVRRRAAHAARRKRSATLLPHDLHPPGPYRSAAPGAPARLAALVPGAPPFVERGEYPFAGPRAPGNYTYRARVGAMQVWAAAREEARANGRKAWTSSSGVATGWAYSPRGGGLRYVFNLETRGGMVTPCRELLPIAQEVLAAVFTYAARIEADFMAAAERLGGGVAAYGYSAPRGQKQGWERLAAATAGSRGGKPGGGVEVQPYTLFRRAVADHRAKGGA